MTYIVAQKRFEFLELSYHPNMKNITANPIVPPVTCLTVGPVEKGDNFVLYKLPIGIKAA